MNKILVACVASLVLSACFNSPATHFYVLAALPSQASSDADAGLAIGIGPLEFPEYLDRPQIVTRNGQNELNVAEFERWGAALKENAGEVLAENMAVLLNSQKISTYPWKRSAQVQYQLTAKIIRFDRSDGGEAELNVRWRILNAEGMELSARQSRYSENPAGTVYVATVAAMNRLLVQFSQEVAVTIKSLNHSHEKSL